MHQKKQKKTWDFDEQFRQQFWAEAKEIWKSGEKLYLEGDILEEAEEAQRGAMEADERVGMIEEYLNTCLLYTSVWVKYKIKDKEVFDKAYSYIEQYY